MSYAVSTSITSQADLMSQVSTFAVARGWTEDNYDAPNYKMSLHKGSCYVHFFWNDTSALGAANGTSIGMYQSIGFTAAGTDSWAHPDDSQNGGAGPSLLGTERGIKTIGPGPYTSLHMFGHTDTDVIYCVLEVAPGFYRHFGFGNIVKSGSWTGGEWVGGHQWQLENTGAYADVPGSHQHSVLLDGFNYGNFGGYTSSERCAATMHVEGLPDQETENPHWGQVGSGYQMADIYREGRDGNKRAVIQGGIRTNFNVQQMGFLAPDLSKGYIPIMPCDIFYYHLIGGDAEEVYYLGRMHNIGMFQMTGVEPQAELAVGGDDWMAFPVTRKAYNEDENQESWNAGIIYMK